MSSSVASNDLVQQTKQSLKTLNAQRRSLEQEADALVSELNDGSQGEPMGLDTPLVDAEGYPRADIDVYRARTLRKRLGEIRTDHNGLMKNIEQTLQQVASLLNPDKTTKEKEELMARSKPKPKPKYDPVTGKWVVMNWDGSVAGAPGGEKRTFRNLSSETPETRGDDAAVVTSTAPLPTRPFARVNSVAPQSPAHQAGLLENDLILAFGEINLNANDSPLPAVGELVPRAAGNKSNIDILVRRGSDATATLHLKPRPWNGRGLIGCHIVPYTG
jgi:26S proteasome non-ATPase regulatory subunit 9